MTALAPAPDASVPWADETVLGEVRPAVRRLLLSSPAYLQLAPEDQRRLAREMVKIGAYLSQPEGVPAQDLVTDRDEPLAQAQAGAGEARERATEDRGFAGQDFEAGAVRQGVEQFGELVRKVDFPQFVSGLIEGVFEAIVDSSIRQMRAYGELVANVAKTVDQFAQDNISENNARDWLTERFPDKLGLEVEPTSGGLAEGEPAPQPQPKLTVTAEDPSAALAEIARELAMPQPPTDLSDEAQEAELVRQARLQIARGRQQLLASMVMLGINRIVVTDGLINAKVVFDMRASDRARRGQSASMYDASRVATSTRASASAGGWLSPYSAKVSTAVDTEHVATVQSSVDETSESQAEVKAKLSGEVRVNFKSDFLPMERMATPEMIAAIQGNAVPPERPVPGA
jgi:hypothetical protein